MDLEKLCRKVINLAEITGAFIQSEKANFNEQTIETKSLHNYVTYVDKTSERQLVDGLSELLPEAGFIAEEGTSNKKGETYNWIIDPLDGTTNYIHGIPCYCISLALMRSNEIVLGVIYDPNTTECFYAWEGSKAYLNGQAIHVSSKPEMKEALIATGFPYHDYGRTEEYLELFEHLMKNSRGLRRLGSAAIDLAYVACGRFDVFYEYGLNAWDVAAGALIVRQAGGEVSDFIAGGDYIFGKEIVATNGKTHATFLKAVQKYFVK